MINAASTLRALPTTARDPSARSTTPLARSTDTVRVTASWAMRMGPSSTLPRVIAMPAANKTAIGSEIFPKYHGMSQNMDVKSTASRIPVARAKRMPLARTVSSGVFRLFRK